MMLMLQNIQNYLNAADESGNLRTLQQNSLRMNGQIVIDAKSYIDLSSNDYLCLSSHPELIQASKTALEKYGTGSGGSRLLCGDIELFDELETLTSDFKNSQAALVFNSGYQANVGILSSVLSSKDVVFMDRNSHASLIDGVLLSKVRHFRFRHNDMQHLSDLLLAQRSRFDNAMIITESVFSMDGDIAPLRDIVELKNRFNASLLVDEAHATGVFGSRGQGIVESEGLSSETDIIVGTFGKALGSLGAYAAVSRTMKQYLTNAARSFVFSTALPPSVIAANIAAIKVVSRTGLKSREHLRALSVELKNLLKERGVITISDSQIIPIIVGETDKACLLARQLQMAGYWTLPIRPPTVPRGEARIRISLTSALTGDDLIRLADEIAKGLK